ncbi:uncharacterized protein LOC118186120 [Stegodyphus dumicola]|uniref:uncharacterized protein LOC118186120 n=1 Tax=Stegodyphus dumicola TaxID=202533 RepID=UPI0015ACEFE6|nr:uncharacterized protein LOC118186120 [Stegodyphus dumicola]
MKRSDTGELLRISELRKEQEGTIVCSVYTNSEFFATKRRFLIKELENEALVVSRNRTHAYKKAADPVNNFKHFSRRKAKNSIPQVLKEQAYALRGQRESEATVKKMKMLKRWKRNVFQRDIPVFQQMNENEEPSNLEKISDSPNEAVSYQPLKYIQSDHSIKYKRSQQKSYQNKGRSTKIRERQLKPPPAEENEYNDDFLNYPIVNVHVTEEEIVPSDSKSGMGTRISQMDDQQAGERGFSIIKTDIVRKQKSKMSADDKISKLITKCKKDRECSMHATCFKYNQKKLGFCKCVSGFHGNGVFCWEDTHDRNPPPFLDDSKDPIKEKYASYEEKKARHHTKRSFLEG